MVILAFGVVAALDARWYGRPLKSGYGQLVDLYGWENLIPNLARYPRWLLDAHTPLVLFAFAVPLLFVAGKREPIELQRRAFGAMLAVFVLALFGCYFFYQPFDAWWYLRFLLPSFPALFVLTAAGLFGFAQRFGPTGPRIAGLLILLVSVRGVAYSADHSVFDVKEGESKYVMVGRYIERRLPEHAAFISVQHSGSIRYYSGRLTVRYDYIGPSQLDAAVDELRRHGYRPYVLLEKSEEPDFRARFAGHSSLSQLDWRPIAELKRPSEVRIYDVDARTAPAESSHIDHIE
jgi:hypothetical protein